MKFFILLALTLFATIFTNESDMNKVFKLKKFTILKNQEVEFKCIDKTVSLVSPIYSKTSNGVKPVEGMSYDEALKLDGASSYGFEFTANSGCPKDKILISDVLDKVGSKYYLPFTSISDISIPAETTKKEYIQFITTKTYNEKKQDKPYYVRLYFEDNKEGMEAREHLNTIAHLMIKEKEKRFSQTIESLSQFKVGQKSNKEEIVKKEQEIKEQTEVYKKQIEKFGELYKQIEAYEKELNELTSAKTTIEDKIKTNSKMLEELNGKKIEMNPEDNKKMETDILNIKEALKKLAPFKKENQILELAQSLDGYVKEKKDLTEFNTKIQNL